METYDCLTLLDTKILDNILGKAGGSVELIDVMPRLCPVSRTPEYIIPTVARISYNNLGLQSIERDSGLINYLYRNEHMSPFEMPVVMFKIEAPISVLRQLNRHRTASINEKSFRYVEDTEDRCYHPLDYEKGLRYKSKTNHQGSSETPEELVETFNELGLKQKQHIQEGHLLYHEMIQNGVAKECARGHLPVNTFSQEVIRMDLRNFLHMLKLRCDHHAQLEIQAYANAMKELVRPLFPQCINLMEEEAESLKIYPSEFEIFKGNKSISSIKSRERKSQLLEYATKLGINLE